MKALSVTVCVLMIVMMVTTVSGETLISKPPDLGPYWISVGNGGHYVFAVKGVVPVNQHNLFFYQAGSNVRFHTQVQGGSTFFLCKFHKTPFFIGSLAVNRMPFSIISLVICAKRQTEKVSP